MIFETKFWCFIITFLSLSHWDVVANILRPRGVAISKASLYIPDRDFVCLDGSLTLPFSLVNDDYCDCRDGSDEPGTAACPNGYFHCTNAGHRPLNIPSSRVNDGICDCCDTSDEYDTVNKCRNTCKDLGRVARIEAQRKVEVHKQGFEIKQELSKRGKELKLEKQNKLIVLEKDRAEAEAIRAEKEKVKLAAEEPEQLALDYYKQQEENEKKIKEEEVQGNEERGAEDTFTMLDSNEDGILDIGEIQTRQTFDQNKDGVVSEEEARFFLQMGDSMDKKEFLKTGWVIMKPYFMLDEGLFIPPTPQPPTDNEPNLEEELSPDDAQYDEDEAELAREMQEEVSRYVKARANWELLTEPADEEGDEEIGEEETGDKPEKSHYDEQTQMLIDTASKARTDFEEADKVLRDLQGELRTVMESMNKDFGHDEEFSPLEGECFEFQDTSYEYKLCPFKEAVQIDRYGTSEVKLGQWGSWSGPDWDKYASMKYDRGQACWNGPTRSVQVVLRCDTEDKLLSVSEPSRCEYMMEFSTPAICTKLEPVSEEHEHDEL